MRQILTDLCELLQEQKIVLERMLELSKEERGIIIDGETERLEGVIRLELKELSKLGAAEKRRMALHKVIAAEMGITDDDITVSKITDKANEDERDTIRDLQKEIMTIIDEHTALNKENRELIKAHMEYSEKMLDMMVGEEDPLNNLYSIDGSEAPERKRTTGFFDGHA